MVCTGLNELGPEDVSLLERCPHFRGWYVQASMELGPEDVSLLERCPHSEGDTIPQTLLFICSSCVSDPVSSSSGLKSSKATGAKFSLFSSLSCFPTRVVTE